MSWLVSLATGAATILVGFAAFFCTYHFGAHDQMGALFLFVIAVVYATLINALRPVVRIWRGKP